MSDGDASPSRRKPVREETSPSKRKASPSRSRNRMKEDDDEAPTSCPAWLQQWTLNIQNSLNSTIEKSIQDLSHQVLKATNIAQNAQEIANKTKSVVIDLTSQVDELTVQIKSQNDEIKIHRDRFDNMGKNDPIEVDEGARPPAQAVRRLSFASASTTAPSLNLANNNNNLSRQKDCIRVGGFDRDTKEEVIMNALKPHFGNHRDIKDFWVTGKRSSFAKIKFHSTDLMWQYIKQLRNKAKLKVTVLGKEIELWQTIERSPDERKRASVLAKVFKAINSENKEICYKFGVIWINDIRCISFDREKKPLKIDKINCALAGVNNLDGLTGICEME